MALHTSTTPSGLLTIGDGGNVVTLTTEDALELFERLTGLLPTMPAPTLILGYDHPADGPDSYVCPHCARVHPFDQAEPSLTEVDADVRHNDAFVGEEGAVHAVQGEQEYATMLFLCGYCGKPVSLPEDTDVTWD